MSTLTPLATLLLLHSASAQPLLAGGGEVGVVCPAPEDGLAVFVPHPRDCGLYYECAGTSPVLMECPPGLYWDQRETVCNWPEASGCSMDFVKVFGHDTAGGLFSSQEEALSSNPATPSAALYSALDTLESYRGREGGFRLRLCYPELTGEGGGQCNEWVQTSNPASEVAVTGFQATSLAFPSNSYDEAWAGLGVSPSSAARTFMDDAPERGWWWCAVGARSYYPVNQNVTTIPGPKGHPVTKVELYVFGKVQS